MNILTILISTIFVNNYVFARFLGICPFLEYLLRWKLQLVWVLPLHCYNNGISHNIFYSTCNSRSIRNWLLTDFDIYISNSFTSSVY